MKIRLFIILSLSVLVLPVFTVSLPVNAQVGTFANTGNTTATGGGSAKNQTQRLANAKERAGQEIDRRITALNKLLNRIRSMKKLSADQIATFSAQIQTEITNLTNLKTKINADNDLKTLQTDIKSIVLSYRVYALFMPKLSLIAAADRMQEITDKLSSLTTRLQTRIQDVKSAGNDVTSLQNALDDLQAKIADAKIQYNAVIKEVTPLTPEDYPDKKATLTDAKSKLKTATADLKAAQQDIKTVLNGLKSFKKNTVSVVPTSTVSTPSAVVTQ